MHSTIQRGYLLDSGVRSTMQPSPKRLEFLIGVDLTLECLFRTVEV